MIRDSRKESEQSNSFMAGFLTMMEETRAENRRRDDENRRREEAESRRREDENRRRDEMFLTLLSRLAPIPTVQAPTVQPPTVQAPTDQTQSESQKEL